MGDAMFDDVEWLLENNERSHRAELRCTVITTERFLSGLHVPSTPILQATPQPVPALPSPPSSTSLTSSTSSSSPPSVSYSSPSPPQSPPSPSVPKCRASSSSSSSSSWLSKYSPRRIEHVCGFVKSRAEAAAALDDLARGVASPGKPRALMLLGTHGGGKAALVHAWASEHKWDVVEPACRYRRELLQALVATRYRGLVKTGEDAKSSSFAGTVYLFRCVDALAEDGEVGEEEGPAPKHIQPTELAKQILETLSRTTGAGKVIVVLTAVDCGDRFTHALWSGLRHVTLAAATDAMVFDVVRTIASRAGFQHAVSDLRVRGFGGDVRAAIIEAQTACLTQSCMRNRSATSMIVQSAFDAARQLLSSRKPVGVVTQLFDRHDPLLTTALWNSYLNETERLGVSGPADAWLFMERAEPWYRGKRTAPWAREHWRQACMARIWELRHKGGGAAAARLSSSTPPTFSSVVLTFGDSTAALKRKRRVVASGATCDDVR